MASNITSYKCPACTGPLHFSGASGKLECEYCGSSYEVAMIEELYAEKEQKAVEAQQKIDARKEREQQEAAQAGLDWSAEEAAALKVYNCSSCGAELICDASTAATSCPYCGNPTVIPSQFSGGLKPELILPFKLDKEAAKKALKAYYKEKRLLPNAFKDENHIEEIKGVYVPFWLFDCKVSGDVTYNGTIEETSKAGDTEIVESKHYIIEREGSMEFEKIPIDASTKMPDAHMDAIEPFDYQEFKPFSTAYLPGFLADKYDVSLEESQKRVEERAKNSMADELEQTVEGYSSLQEFSNHLVVEEAKGHYALLPVWMLSTRWNGENYLFAMNGQTGKLVGDLPVDKKKYYSYFAGIALPLAALILGMWFL